MNEDPAAIKSFVVDPYIGKWFSRNGFSTYACIMPVQSDTDSTYTCIRVFLNSPLEGWTMPGLEPEVDVVARQSLEIRYTETAVELDAALLVSVALLVERIRRYGSYA